MGSQSPLILMRVFLFVRAFYTVAQADNWPWLPVIKSISCLLGKQEGSEKVYKEKVTCTFMGKRLWVS